jgi:hypothetical protein
MDHSHQHPTPAPGDGDTAISDPPGGHGMAVIGTDTVFFSHLPMFMSPHNYQVILEGRLAPDAAAVYREDREAHAGELYTFNPVPFVLPDLFARADGQPARRRSFEGTLFRNHFEEPPAHPEPRVEIADAVPVEVVTVVHSHKFDPNAVSPERAQYLLFGRGRELFAAHVVSNPPDFDQLLSVEIEGRDFTDDDLQGGSVMLTVPDRANEFAERLKAGQRVTCIAADGEIQLTVNAELYVETNDLKEAM